MDSVGLELVFDGTFGNVKVNFGGSEKLKSNGLSLVFSRALLMQGVTYQITSFVS